jgi:cell division protein FtsL
MAKIIVRKKRRRVRIEGLVTLIFFGLVIVKVISTLVLGTINDSLTMKVQQTEIKIANLRTENANLEVAIKELVNKEHVFAVADANGMNIDQANVIAIATPASVNEKE